MAKVIRAVLRGGGDSNAASLPDTHQRGCQTNPPKAYKGVATLQQGRGTIAFNVGSTIRAMFHCKNNWWFKCLPRGGAMIRRMFAASSIVCLMALEVFSQSTEQPESSVVVTGRVLNEKGQPVAKAKVCASPTVAAVIGELDCDHSNSGGAFRIFLRGSIEYTITAVKEREGYPDTSNTFYGPPATLSLPKIRSGLSTTCY